jgi:hypothetical protein
VQASPAFAAPAVKKVDPFTRSQEEAALFQKLLRERGVKLPEVKLSEVRCVSLHMKSLPP